MSVTFSTKATDACLNVSNANFRSLMALLDIECDCYGEFTGDLLADLKTRVQFALDALRAMPELDEGTPAVDYTTPGGTRFIDCGRSDGYYAHRLSELLTIIDAALAHGNALWFG